MANKRSNRPSFKSSLPQSPYFHKFELSKYAHTPYMLNLATKKAFTTKFYLREASGLITINGMERHFFLTEIEARRETARSCLINEHHYQTKIKQFDVLNDPRWQADIEAKEGRFQLDRYRSSAFQHGSMVYNPR